MLFNSIICLWRILASNTTTFGDGKIATVQCLTTNLSLVIDSFVLFKLSTVLSVACRHTKYWLSSKPNTRKNTHVFWEIADTYNNTQDNLFSLYSSFSTQFNSIIRALTSLTHFCLNDSIFLVHTLISILKCLKLFTQAIPELNKMVCCNLN